MTEQRQVRPRTEPAIETPWHGLSPRGSAPTASSAPRQPLDSIAQVAARETPCVPWRPAPTEPDASAHGPLDSLDLLDLWLADCESSGPAHQPPSWNTSDMLRAVDLRLSLLQSLDSQPSLPQGDGPSNEEAQSVYQPAAASAARLPTAGETPLHAPLESAPASRASLGPAGSVASWNTADLLLDIDLGLQSPHGSQPRSGHAGASRNDEVQSVYLTSKIGAHGAPVAGAAPAAPVMPPAMAVQWYRDRMADLDLIEVAFPRHCESLGRAADTTARGTKALFGFAVLLSEADANDTLRSFLWRYRSPDPHIGSQARQQMREVLNAEPAPELLDVLDTMAALPADRLEALCTPHNRAHGEVQGAHRKWPIPPQDRAAMEGSRTDGINLVLFSAALLRAGHGGLTEWVAMFEHGRDRLARHLMLEYMRTNQGKIGLAPALDRFQQRAGIEPAHRIRVGETGATFIGNKRHRPAADPQPARAGLEPPLMRPGNVGADNFEILDVFYEMATTLGLAESTSRTRRAMLKHLAEFLMRRDPEDGLRSFLLRYESPDAEVKSRALALIEDFVNEAPPEGNKRRIRRNDLKMALEIVTAVPPEERTLSQPVAMVPMNQVKRLPQQDQDLLERMRRECEQEQEQGRLSAGHIAHMFTALTRFSAALGEQGAGGLTQWLAMLDDDRHAVAKSALDDFIGNAGEETRRKLIPGLGRLQRVADTLASDALRTNPRPGPGRLPFPAGFPPAEARLIGTALSALRREFKFSGMTLDSWRVELVNFSTWLRQQQDRQGRPVFPGGLHDMLGLEQGGERGQIERLRYQYLNSLPVTNAETLRDRQNWLKRGLRELLRHDRHAPVQTPGVAGPSHQQERVESPWSFELPATPSGGWDWDLNASQEVTGPEWSPPRPAVSAPANAARSGRRSFDDAAGADWQHQWALRAPDRLNDAIARSGIGTGDLITIRDQTYRVSESGDSGFNPSDGNPMGKRYDLHLVMRGG